MRQLYRQVYLLQILCFTKYIVKVFDIRYIVTVYDCFSSYGSTVQIVLMNNSVYRFFVTNTIGIVFISYVCCTDFLDRIANRLSRNKAVGNPRNKKDNH